MTNSDSKICINKLWLLPVEQITPEETHLSKTKAIKRFVTSSLESGILVSVSGVVEIVNEHCTFLRYIETSFEQGEADIYLPISLVKKFSLQDGDLCLVDLESGSKIRGLQAGKILSINGQNIDSDKPIRYPSFLNMNAIFPIEKIDLDRDGTLTTRLLDIVCPIGYGQRVIIAAEPKCGKTSLLENVAQVCGQNERNEVIALLISERPEETLYFKRKVPKAKVLSSSFDDAPQRHVRLTSLAVAYCMRQVETGRDVILLIDSLTRYVRAVNLLENNGGKILTGGLEAKALLNIKKILGAARKIENGGSLTILATLLINSGSKMDSIVFEESRGTSNCDIVLVSELANKGIFPSVDLMQTSTRRSELMMPREIHEKAMLLKQMLFAMNHKHEALKKILEQIRSYDSNNAMLEEIALSSDR
jgi:transcription termination factor Rho